jgi:hypothetical protein
MGNWASTTLVDTPTFVAAVGPLSSHPDVQAELATTISTRVDTQIRKAVQDAPFPLSMLGALLPQLTNQINSAVTKAVKSDVAETAWTKAVTVLHDQTITAIRGDNAAVALDNGTATIDLNELKAPIVAGLSIPDVVKGPLTQIDLGSITVKTGVPSWAVTIGLKAADSWLVLLLAGIVLAFLAALAATRAGRGLLWSGIAITVCCLLAYLLALRSLHAQTPPDALSAALVNAISSAIEPSLARKALIGAASGIVLIVLGTVLSLVGKRRVEAT